MADTKQATPDECMRIGCGLPAAHLVHNRPSIGEYPIINYHDFVASRSGPDRTTPDAVQHSIDKYRPALEALARDDGDGPDRGQQDAPLTDVQIERVLSRLENKPCSFGHKRPTRYCSSCGPFPDPGAAKAAWEGQAPTGDRIKVEREPGCKCEYAIWTNAKGCPLHDVQGKSSDSEKQG